MPRKSAYIIIAIVTLLVVGGLFAFYYFYLRENVNFQDFLSQNTERAGKNGGFGEGEQAQPSDETGGEGAVTDSTEPELPLKLRKISDGPIAGGIAFDRSIEKIVDGKKKAVSQTVIRYVERTKGFVFETEADAKESRRISNSPLPKIKEAFWSRTGSVVYLRYYSEDAKAIETYYAKLAPATKKTATTTLELESEIDYPPQELQGFFMTKNIGELIPSQTRDSVLYFKTSADSKGQGIIAQLDDTKRVEVFNSPVSEWSPAWIKDNIVALTTKPAASVPGFLYFLNIDTQNLERVLGNVRGLTALVSPDMKTVLYSTSGNTDFAVFVYDVKTGVVKNFPIKTLPEKCLWSKKQANVLFCAVPDALSPSQIYPDNWYKGVFSFSDDIWKINLTTGETDEVASPQTLVKERLDIIRPFFSPKEDYLLFLNKTDGSFWSLNLN